MYFLVFFIYFFILLSNFDLFFSILLVSIFIPFYLSFIMLFSILFNLFYLPFILLLPILYSFITYPFYSFTCHSCSEEQVLHVRSSGRPGRVHMRSRNVHMRTHTYSSKCICIETKERK